MNYAIFYGIKLSNTNYYITYLYNPTNREIYILESDLTPIQPIEIVLDTYVETINVCSHYDSKIYPKKVVSLKSLAEIAKLINGEDILSQLAQHHCNNILCTFDEIEHKQLYDTIDKDYQSILNTSVNVMASKISSEEGLSYQKALSRIDQLFKEKFHVSRRQELALPFLPIALNFILNINGWKLVGDNYTYRNKSI